MTNEPDRMPLFFEFGGLFYLTNCVGHPAVYSFFIFEGYFHSGKGKIHVILWNSPKAGNRQNLTRRRKNIGGKPPQGKTKGMEANSVADRLPGTCPPKTVFRRVFPR